MGQSSYCLAKKYDICGSRAFVNESSNFKSWLLVYGAFVILVICAMLRYMVRWINYKDYFPLKERSPILCLLLILVLSAQLIIYPAQILVNYFMTGHEGRDFFRVTYSALRTMGSFIYVLRTLRINYAYRLQGSMRNHWVFRLFKNEMYLVLIVLCLMVLRIIPPMLCPKAYPSSVALISEDGTIFFTRALIETVIWHFFLISCLWTQKDMRMQFGLVPEIGSILAASLLTSAAEITTAFIYFFGQGVSFDTVVQSFQCYQLQLPLNQIIVMFTALVMFIASIAYPLTKMQQKHELLPIQQVYDLQNNLRAFLLQPLYFKMFYSFLQQFQQKLSSDKELKSRASYLMLVNAWTKITMFKLQENTDLTELVDFFRGLDNSIFPKSLVGQLYESSHMIGESLEASERDKVRNSINMALEELQDDIIGQLSTIYKNRFRKTCAFTFLKKAMQENDRINTNLLMLNMILREHSDL